MKFISAIVLFISSLHSLDFQVTNMSISNGATSLLEFKKESSLSYTKITLGKKSYKIYENPVDSTKLYALLPISYYAKPKNVTLNIHYKKNSRQKTQSVQLKIQDGQYKKENIQVSSSKVNPKSKEVKKRISQEYSEAMKIYGTSTNENHVSSKFILPMESFITSDFGKARVYNNTLKGYHSGTDFRAKVGTPIIASNDGVVTLVKDRFYSGGTIIINHGQGIYTCYYHMSQLDLKLGQKIKKGQVIGLSGKSGRVTGPHLHFSVRVAGVQVDPLQFVQLINDTIFEKQQDKKEL